MKDFLKKNLILIIAFALPILFIGGVALYARFPFAAASTAYDFVYASCKGSNYVYNCENYLRDHYSVLNGKLVINEVDKAKDYDGDGQAGDGEKFYHGIFLHNTKTNESREISIEEAGALSLNNLSTSPDGASISNANNRGSDFLFGGGYYYDFYLKKGKATKKLELLTQQGSYSSYNNFYLVGWVLPGREKQ